MCELNARPAASPVFPTPIGCAARVGIAPDQSGGGWGELAVQLKVMVQSASGPRHANFPLFRSIAGAARTNVVQCAEQTVPGTESGVGPTVPVTLAIPTCQRNKSVCRLLASRDRSATNTTTRYHGDKVLFIALTNNAPPRGCCFDQWCFFAIQCAERVRLVLASPT